MCAVGFSCAQTSWPEASIYQKWTGCFSMTPQAMQGRAVRYNEDEIKSIFSYYVYILYRLYCGVAKYIVYGKTFSSFEWLRSLYK